MSHFYDFDTRKDNHQIEPKSTREDILNGDNAPVLCDICPNGIRLEAYLGDKLICPNCMTVTDPTFDHVQHEAIETTIEEYAETHSGELSYVSDRSDNRPLHLTRIRKKLQEDELPEYVKKEIEFIKWRPGYKVIPMKKEKLSDRTNK